MNKIFTIFLALIFISCENNIRFNQLEHDEKFTYHENKKFTGVAIEKDDFDNIRIEKYYEDGKNYLTKLYDSKKRIQSEWTYNNILVKVTRYHKDGSIESKENFDPSYKRNGKSISYYKNGNLALLIKSINFYGFNKKCSLALRSNVLRAIRLC